MIKKPYLIILSAKSESALKRAVYALIKDLETNQDILLQDISYTYQVSKKHYSHRFAIVCDNKEVLKNELIYFKNNRSHIKSIVKNKNLNFILASNKKFLNHTINFYKRFSFFNKSIERCSEKIKSYLHVDFLRTFSSYVLKDEIDILDEFINSFLIFCVEYSVCRLWNGWGFKPKMIISNDASELVAACFANIISFKDAISILIHRAYEKNTSHWAFEKYTIDLKNINSIKFNEEKIKLINSNSPLRCSSRIKKIDYWLNRKLNIDDNNQNIIFENAIYLNFGLNNCSKKSEAEFLVYNCAITKDTTEIDILNIIGELWCMGTKINWYKFNARYF